MTEKKEPSWMYQPVDIELPVPFTKNEIAEIDEIIKAEPKAMTRSALVRFAAIDLLEKHRKKKPSVSPSMFL